MPDTKLCVHVSMRLMRLLEMHSISGHQIQRVEKAHAKHES